jgi:hypothetical protein
MTITTDTTTTVYYELGGKGQFDEPGTEGTHKYDVLIATSIARVSYRSLPGGIYRVRVQLRTDDPAVVEALAPSFPSPAWKQPVAGGQFRFSIVVPLYVLHDALQSAVVAVLSLGGQVEINEESLDAAVVLEAQSIVDSAREHAELVAQVRSLGVPGSNGASRWSTPVLESKLAAARADLTARAKALGIKGVNRRWSLPVLQARVQERELAQ